MKTPQELIDANNRHYTAAWKDFLKNPNEFMNAHSSYYVDEVIEHGYEIDPENPYFKKNGYIVKEWKF